MTPVAVAIGEASLERARAWAPAGGLGAGRSEVTLHAGGAGLLTSRAAPGALDLDLALHRFGPDWQRAFEVF
jgi:hypothetical protein